MIRAFWRLALVVLTLSLSPTLVYEALQKTAESTDLRHPVLRLSLRAESETRWRRPSGIDLVDRAVHEWEEARRFYRLARLRLAEPPRP